MRTSRREWPLGTALAILTGAVLLLLVEAGLRVGGFGIPTSFLVPIRGRPAFTTNGEFGGRFLPRTLAGTPVPCVLPGRKDQRTYRVFVLGESAAMGVPEPGFSFGRILEALLRGHYPGVPVELVNAAMPGINSHLVLPIARDCGIHRPDLFIVLVGNNEVVGPYGPGAASGSAAPNLTLLRLAIWGQSTRTGQLLERWAPALRRRSGGLEMAGRLVSAGDPALEPMYGHYRRNLVNICKEAARRGAAVILCTVAANLRDNPPFASLHRPDLAAQDQAAWEALYRIGAELEESGDYALAVEKYLAAASIDDRYAELHFRLGRCYLALGRAEQAGRHYALARDLDALRLRADSRLNAIIREVASGRRRVRLADAERAFAGHSPGGVPGSDFFHDHVHMNFSGNDLLARTVFERVRELAPWWMKPRARTAASLPAPGEVATLVALTGWDRYQIAGQVLAMTDRPPFTQQLEYERRRRQGLEELVTLRHELTTAAALEAARRAYQEAIRRRPEDIHFRLRYAELLRQCGDYSGAAGQWRALLGWLPGNQNWRAALAALPADRNAGHQLP